ncbi:MAG TPA: FG-GAP-like repeat-containing protein [Bryobacteraceae bacterium]|nr:FG-GAP-like repeat-containing protein [Bryobacteraceae bacterium]
MKRVLSIQRLTRREFLSAAAAIPALTCVFPAALRASGVGPNHAASYLELKKFILPGQDEFTGEAKAFQIHDLLVAAFHSKQLPGGAAIRGSSPAAKSYRQLDRDLEQAEFDSSEDDVAGGWRKWIESLGEVRRVEFFVLPEDVIRYEVASREAGRLRYCVGTWRQRWDGGKLLEFVPVEEHVASAGARWFQDVTAAAMKTVPECSEQFARGVPYWRARLDPASGIDIYGSNGVSVGDIDNDGEDEIYVCQPGGLPNRLLKFNADGTMQDLTDEWGVGLLDDTSCALFCDLRNSGRQDLVVLRGGGPVLYVNEGGRFRLRTDAFRFATLPKGAFTGMAAADFDRDGKLDLYLCCYVYFQSEAQYTYAAPYDDARNGPPNFLFRNRLDAQGGGWFEDVTAEAGMMENNDRFSFAPAWCDYNGDGWPDLYVANDFGRKNLYKNDRGHFRDVAAEAGADDIGPGMSASWFDYDGDGRPDVYVANMWTAAGQRVIGDPAFAPARKDPVGYRSHTMGNTLLRNRGDGTFADATAEQQVGFGRWAWSSGGHDLDNDGRPEIYVTCGMLTNESATDLGSFFWRQVVAHSPETAMPSRAYENGWNAINQFTREDYSWNGCEPNVVHARRGDRYFDFSGVTGLDFADDSRAFAVVDFDLDGRPDVILKSRMGPQVRVLQNNCAGANASIAFRLTGTKSNRDAIGARITVDGQTKWLEAGSSFLSQHSKRVLFGLGSQRTAPHVRIVWPSGAAQEFANLEAGHEYSIAEGQSEAKKEPFREHRAFEPAGLEGINEMRLQDTWFLEPVPLPDKQAGPGLFVLKESREEYEIFRRYLFDWRAPLRTPFAMLLNGSGDAVKVYGEVPGPEQVDADLKQLGTQSPALPYRGVYLTPPKRDFFKFGAAFLWAGYYQQALPYLERVLRQTPDNARVLVLVGQLQLDASRPDVAEDFFQRALAADAKSVDALIGLGDVAAQRGRDQKASEYYGRALAADPQSAEAANGLGLALAKLGQTDRAREYLEKAIALRRDYADAINNLGVLYTRLGQMNDAVAAFSYGVKVAPDRDILYLNLGRAYVRTGQIEKARGVMQQLLERQPDNATARHALEELSGH